MRHLITGTVLVLALAAAGCRVAPIYNAEGVAFTAAPAVPARVLTLDDYEAAIVRAGARRGWTFERQAPGQLVGNIAVRAKHFATVDVTFDTETFWIRYKSSSNLNYNRNGLGQIHPNYNAWVSNLEGEIQSEIALMKAG